MTPTLNRHALILKAAEATLTNRRGLELFVGTDLHREYFNLFPEGFGTDNNARCLGLCFMAAIIERKHDV